ncbi:DNA-processing protein DprA [Hydrogenophaga sp. 5NK40-0174]|uniref:DNA-processing protein DprA n=1 Tax=Hydrogenophaga sp. 5NK40-0174 TaxID=3127649 RepID=UPI0033405C74
MASDELAAWLQMLSVPGLGRGYARRLLAAFALPQAVFRQNTDALTAVVGPKLARAMVQHVVTEASARLIEQHQGWLTASDARAPRQVVAMGDPAYPTELLETADPPLLLFVEGQLDLLKHPTRLAMVGSRNPTPQGVENARAFSHALASAGLCVVSGLARGIDGAAHEGALDAAGPTIAVVGTGLDQTYPKRHAGLAERIVTQGGAIVSEYLLGTPPLAAHFPQRNRIVSGLSQGTLVVEATLQSGSLITARQALEQGREVFAIPGSIHAPQVKGCHALIRQGAKLVESAQDVLEDLRLAPAKGAKNQDPSLGDHSQPSLLPAEACDNSILEAMGFDPMGLDAIQARTGLGTAKLQADLLELELDGVIARLPGGLWQRMGTG